MARLSLGCFSALLLLGLRTVSADSVLTAAASTTTAPLICYQDNCLRALLRFSSMGGTFCATYTTTVDTQPTDIPSFLDNCFGSPSAVSSACTCLVPYETAAPSSSPTSVSISTTSDSSTSGVPTTSTESSGPTSPPSSTGGTTISSTIQSTGSDSSTSSTLPTSSPTSSTLYTNSSTSSVPTIPASSSPNSEHATSTSSGELGYTTSTVYSTKVKTITKCPPTVTNCPVGSVTTKTVAVSTTVCPISETTSKPAEESSKGYKLSTVYATTTYTITSCAPTVTNCPVGKVTTETVSLYTTYCLITEVPSTTSTTTFQASLASGSVKSVGIIPVPVATLITVSSGVAGVTYPVASASGGIVTSTTGNATWVPTSTPAQVTASGAELVSVKWMSTGLVTVLAGMLLL